MVGYMGMFLLIFVALMAMTNFFLSDNTQTYGLSKNADPIDYGFLGLAFLALLIFLLYFGFRKGDRSSGNNNASFRAFKDSNVTDPQFDRVHQNLRIASSSGSGPTVAPGNFLWDSAKNPTPTFDTSSTTCSDATKCISRLAVLA
jgi:hypothetical protein